MKRTELIATSSAMITPPEIPSAAATLTTATINSSSSETRPDHFLKTVEGKEKWQELMKLRKELNDTADDLDRQNKIINVLRKDEAKPLMLFNLIEERKKTLDNRKKLGEEHEKLTKEINEKIAAYNSDKVTTEACP